MSENLNSKPVHPYKKKFRIWENLIQIAIIFGVYCLSQLYYYRIASLPQEAYFSNSIFFHLIKENLFIVPFYAVLLLISFCRYKAIGYEIIDSDNTVKIKYFIFAVSLVVAYSFATYDYNLYFDNSHLVDRLILIGLSLSLLWSPLFLPIFVVFALAMMAQFSWPLGNYSITDKRMMFSILILFNSFLYTKLLFKRVSSINFIFVALYLYSISYFVPGFSKLESGWTVTNNLYNLVVSSYSNGWLEAIDERNLLNIVSIFQFLNKPIQIGAVIVELVGIFFLAHRYAPYIILPSLVFFHVSIFALTGIFFWKVIILNICLLFLIASLKSSSKDHLFSKIYCFLFVVMTAISPFSFDWLYSILKSDSVISSKPIDLTWYDTKLNTFYELEAVGASGEVYRISRNFMSPYDIIFVQNRFQYLDDREISTLTYGAVGLNQENIHFEIERVSQYDAQESDVSILLDELESQYGTNFYSEEKSDIFSNFIKVYFSNLNKRQSKKMLLSHIPTAHHIWTLPKGDDNVFKFQEVVESVRIKAVKVYFDGKEIHILEEVILDRIEIE